MSWLSELFLGSVEKGQHFGGVVPLMLLPL